MGQVKFHKLLDFRSFRRSGADIDKDRPGQRLVSVVHDRRQRWLDRACAVMIFAVINSHQFQFILVLFVIRQPEVADRPFIGVDSFDQNVVIFEKDLGRKIVARVDIKEKTTRDGRKYIMLDIHKALISDGPSLKIKFVEDLEEGGINIPQTETKIVFRSMPH